LTSYLTALAKGVRDAVNGSPPIIMQFLMGQTERIERISRCTTIAKYAGAYLPGNDRGMIPFSGTCVLHRRILRRHVLPRHLWRHHGVHLSLQSANLNAGQTIEPSLG
jgi:hypothetical protein